MMRVAEVMTRGAEAVPAEATVQEAALAMAEHDIGAILITEGDTLQGILTDRDIILRLVVDGRDPTKVRVREVMSSTLFTCREDDTADAAFHQMTEHQVRRLPVVDQDGRAVGVLTLGDLAPIADRLQQARESLRVTSEPHRSPTAGPGRDTADDAIPERPECEASRPR